jgi:hypothetical protein
MKTIFSAAIFAVGIFSKNESFALLLPVSNKAPVLQEGNKNRR